MDIPTEAEARELLACMSKDATKCQNCEHVLSRHFDGAGCVERLRPAGAQFVAQDGIITYDKAGAYCACKLEPIEIAATYLYQRASA